MENSIVAVLAPVPAVKKGVNQAIEASLDGDAFLGAMIAGDADNDCPGGELALQTENVLQPKSIVAVDADEFALLPESEEQSADSLRDAAQIPMDGPLAPTVPAVTITELTHVSSDDDMPAAVQPMLPQIISEGQDHRPVVANSLPGSNGDSLAAFLSHQSGVTAEFAPIKPAKTSQSPAERAPAPLLKPVPVGTNIPDVAGLAASEAGDGTVPPADSVKVTGDVVEEISSEAQMRMPAKRSLTIQAGPSGDKPVIAQTLGQPLAHRPADMGHGPIPNNAAEPQVTETAAMFTVAKPKMWSVGVDQGSDLVLPMMDQRLPVPEAVSRQPFSVGSNTSTEAHGASVVRQIADAVISNGDGQIEVKLSPEELGRVRIVISGNEQARHVTVWFDRADIGDAARRNVDQLRQDLLDSGFGDTALDFRDDGRQRQAWDSAQPAWGRDHDDAGAGLHTLSDQPVTPMLTRPPLVDGRLDIRI